MPFASPPKQTWEGGSRHQALDLAHPPPPPHLPSPLLSHQLPVHLCSHPAESAPSECSMSTSLLSFCSSMLVRVVGQPDPPRSAARVSLLCTARSGQIRGRASRSGQGAPDKKKGTEEPPQKRRCTTAGSRTPATCKLTCSCSVRRREEMIERPKLASTYDTVSLQQSMFVE